MILNETEHLAQVFTVWKDHLYHHLVQWALSVGPLEGDP